MIINWQKAAGYQLTFVANVDQVSAELLRAGSNHIDLLFNWCLKKKRERKEVRYKERERERELIGAELVSQHFIRGFIAI